MISSRTPQDFAARALTSFYPLPRTFSLKRSLRTSQHDVAVARSNSRALSHSFNKHDARPTLLSLNSPVVSGRRLATHFLTPMLHVNCVRTHFFSSFQTDSVRFTMQSRPSSPLLRAAFRSPQSLCRRPPRSIRQLEVTAKKLPLLPASRLCLKRREPISRNWENVPMFVGL